MRLHDARPVLAMVLVLVLFAAACTASTPAGPGAKSGPERDLGWRAASLRDVRTGATFTIGDLRGKLVAIEPMAIWCSTCRIQQREAFAAIASVASPDLAYIGVDVDPNEQADALAAYADREGFSWTFVVASPDTSRSLAAAFGDQVLSPPSTPLILLAPDGTVVDVHFGIRRAEELAKLFKQYLP